MIVSGSANIQVVCVIHGTRRLFYVGLVQRRRLDDCLNSLRQESIAVPRPIFPKRDRIKAIVRVGVRVLRLVIYVILVFRLLVVRRNVLGDRTKH